MLTPVPAGDRLGRSFAGPIRAHRQQRVILPQWPREIGRLPIGLGGADDEDPGPDLGAPDRLQQVPGANGVDAECLPGVLHGAADRRHGRQMVHLVRADVRNDPDEMLMVDDVCFGEVETSGALRVSPDFFQVLQGATGHNQPEHLRPAREKELGQVRPGESRGAGH
jgi:hypothetical protein